MELGQMDIFTMLETAEIADALCWDDETQTLRTVILGMCEEFVNHVTGDLIPAAENMINKTWNELNTQEQKILTVHGIVQN